MDRPSHPTGAAERDGPRQSATAIARRLQQHGYVAYLAGGCVRDRLLGLEPKDYDVATDAKPATVTQLFPHGRFVGEAFGVVLVHQRGHQVEVATFRTESSYMDGRRPSQVRFADAQGDAIRRDFTINGLFEDPLTGQVIDHVGGRADLEAGLIRAIGQPGQRFAEDHLRMLRAVRFATRLGFGIERATAAAIRANAACLAQISRERIGLELMWMFTGPRPAHAAQWLQRLGLDAPVLTEPSQSCSVAGMRRLRGANHNTALAAWALDRHVRPRLPRRCDREEMVREVERFVENELTKLVIRWRHALSLSNDQRDALRGCLLMLPTALAWCRLGMAQRKRLLADPQSTGALSLLATLPARGTAALLRRIDQDAEILRHDGVTPPPLVDGHDLIHIGRVPGPEFNRLLTMVYDAQLEGVVRTRPQALDWLKRHLALEVGP